MDRCIILYFEFGIRYVWKEKKGDKIKVEKKILIDICNLKVRLSIYLYIHKSSIFLCIYLFIYLPTYLYIFMSIYLLSMYLFIYLPIYLFLKKERGYFDMLSKSTSFIYLSIPLSIFLSTYMIEN